jgi:hypothetical protein
MISAFRSAFSRSFRSVIPIANLLTVRNRMTAGHRFFNRSFYNYQYTRINGYVKGKEESQNWGNASRKNSLTQQYSEALTASPAATLPEW